MTLANYTFIAEQTRAEIEKHTFNYLALVLDYYPQGTENLISLIKLITPKARNCLFDAISAGVLNADTYLTTLTLGNLYYLYDYLGTLDNILMYVNNLPGSLLP
jgi:hypothetical protein